MNLPNSLTISRIIFVPLLVVVLLTDFQGRVIFGVPTELVTEVQALLARRRSA